MAAFRYDCAKEEVKPTGTVLSLFMSDNVRLHNGDEETETEKQKEKMRPGGNKRAEHLALDLAIASFLISFFIASSRRPTFA